MNSPTEQDKTAVKLAIAHFRSKLVRQFREWAACEPPGFRNFVLGTMKAALPKQRAGRKSNPVVIRAHQLYLKRLRPTASNDIKRKVFGVVERVHNTEIDSRLLAQIRRYGHSDVFFIRVEIAEFRLATCWVVGWTSALHPCILSASLILTARTSSLCFERT
jgi:hypothetical protein